MTKIKKKIRISSTASHNFKRYHFDHWTTNAGNLRIKVMISFKQKIPSTKSDRKINLWWVSTIRISLRVNVGK